MVKVVWTDSAIEDLDGIGEYISKDSVRYAEITVANLLNATDILENHPYAGVMVPDFQDESVREIIKGSYRIVYKIINDFRIDVLTVHNSARLLGNTYDFSEFDKE